MSNLSSNFTSDRFHFTCERHESFIQIYGEHYSTTDTAFIPSFKRRKTTYLYSWTYTHGIRHGDFCVWHELDFSFTGEIDINNSITIKADLEFLVRP